MKGAAHFHSLPAQDNLVLKRAQSVNKLVSEVSVGESHSPVCSPFLQWMQWPCWQTPLLASPIALAHTGQGELEVRSSDTVSQRPACTTRETLPQNKQNEAMHTACMLPVSKSGVHRAKEIKSFSVGSKLPY